MTDFVTVDCPACSSPEALVINHAVPVRDASDVICGTTDISECKNCGTGYLRQRLSDAALGAFYQSELLSNWYETDYRRIAKRHRKQLSQYVEILTKFSGTSSNGQALDFGCGSGGAAAALSKRGYNVMAFDTSAVARRMALELNGVHVVNSLQDVAPWSFNAIALLDVIEHVPDPASLVAYLSTLLAPGGHILIATPNYNSVMRYLKGVSWSGYDTRAHLLYFTEASLKGVVEKAGLRVKYSRSWGFMSRWIPFPGGQALTMVAQKPA